MSSEGNADYKTLGNRSFREGNYERAVNMFREASRFDPNDSSVLSNLSLAHIKLCQFEDALRAADSALELKNDNIKAYYRAYLACKNLRLHSRGRLYVKDALRYRPDNKLLLKAYEEYRKFPLEQRIRYLYTADEMIFLLKRNDDKFYNYGLLAIKTLFTIFREYYLHIDRTRVPGSIHKFTNTLTDWTLKVPLNNIMKIGGLRQYIILSPLTDIPDTHVEQLFCKLEFHYRPFSRLVLGLMARFVLERKDLEALSRIVFLARQKYVRRNCGGFINEILHMLLATGINGFLPSHGLRVEFFRRGGLVAIAQAISEYSPFQNIGKKLIRLAFQQATNGSSPDLAYKLIEIVEVIKYLVFFKDWYKDTEISDICEEMLRKVFQDPEGRSFIRKYASTKPPKFGWVFNDFCRFYLDQVERDSDLVSNPRVVLEKWEMFKKRQFDENVKCHAKRWKKTSTFDFILM